MPQPLDPRTVIADLRRNSVAGRDLTGFAHGLADGTVSDAQAGAFAMAVYLRGLDDSRRAALALGMRDTGVVLDWNLPGPVVDKHSTGGVGDCVSLVLAPALAACGAFVPMVSGRGLGHTGGTLDKLEAIPGLRTSLTRERFQSLVAETGCAIVSAGDEIAPADQRLYGIRDLTATIDNVDLITASILSKKLAVAPKALVLDVKTGRGAFMKSLGEAQALAQILVSSAAAAGCVADALVTDMNQSLVPSIGNALEIAEVMRVFDTGSGSATRLVRLVALLGGALLDRAGLADDSGSGETRIEAAITDGSAAERFFAMVRAMGGPGDFAENWRRLLPQAPVVREIKAPRAGFVGPVDSEALGHAAMRLGAGRFQSGDRIDPAVGFSGIRQEGVPVKNGDLLALVHADSEEAADYAEATALVAMRITDSPLPSGPLVLSRVCG